MPDPKVGQAKWLGELRRGTLRDFDLSADELRRLLD